MELIFLLFVLAILGLPIWLYVKLRSVRKEKEAALKQLKEAQRENQLLETHHLKFQMQPHALNNILSELKAVSKKLERGMGALSSTLEYILYKGQMNLVSVEEEVDFLRRYVQLHELFVPNLNAMELDDSGIDRRSPYYHTACIPHLATGYLIENAFKHGDRNHPEFLRIKVKLSEKFFQVHVANRVLSKPREGPGGLGLHNMKKRMDLLLPDRHRLDSNREGDVYHAILTIQFQP
ncbi:MAG: histidine kinase [Flavobacteriales bacterium]|nr:histidine kinase [Flavobacteriales bacterium]